MLCHGARKAASEANKINFFNTRFYFAKRNRFQYLRAHAKTNIHMCCYPGGTYHRVHQQYATCSKISHFKRFCFGNAK